MFLWIFPSTVNCASANLALTLQYGEKCIYFARGWVGDFDDGITAETPGFVFPQFPFRFVAPGFQILLCPCMKRGADNPYQAGLVAFVWAPGGNVAAADRVIGDADLLGKLLEVVFHVKQPAQADDLWASESGLSLAGHVYLFGSRISRLPGQGSDNRLFIGGDGAADCSAELLLSQVGLHICREVEKGSLTANNRELIPGVSLRISATSDSMALNLIA